MRSTIVLLLLSAALATSSAFKQKKNGSIAGVVKDATTKAPLNEAVITVSSSVLKGQKIALTDSTGHYRILDLPAGNYSVTFEMEGFRKYIQDSVRLIEGMSLGVSLDMAKDRRGNLPTQKRRKKEESTSKID